MNLRELRLWHWRRALKHRENQTRHLKAADEWGSLEGTKSQRAEMTHNLRRARAEGRLADFHISAVQALNDCFPDPLDTAEKDAAAPRA